MELIIVFFASILSCIVIVSFCNSTKNVKNSESKRSRLLYCSSNRNSYEEAGDVFKKLDSAGLEPNFLGGKHD